LSTFKNKYIKIIIIARSRWLTSVILAIWEVEMWRIAVQGQLRQIVHEALS
jgi:hypothetical protein